MTGRKPKQSQRTGGMEDTGGCAMPPPGGGGVFKGTE